jgi:hypothetical protein
MNKWYKLRNWLYSTWIGDLYLSFLIWKDAKTDSGPRFLTPGEAATIIREYSLLTQGVTKAKKTVNALVASKSKEEYHRVLSELNNMIDLSDYDDNDVSRRQFGNVIREISVKKGNQDIVTPQDKLNMIHQRIEDYKELHAHQAKRNLMRQLRKARQENNQELAKQLETELREKYGQRH